MSEKNQTKNRAQISALAMLVLYEDMENEHEFFYGSGE